MKRIAVVAFLTFLIALIPFSGAYAKPPEIPSIIIVPFSDNTQISKTTGYGSAVTQMINTYFRNNSNFKLLNYTDVAGLLDMPANAGIPVPSTAVLEKLKSANGIDIIIAGGVSVFEKSEGKIIEIDMNFVETELKKGSLANYKKVTNEEQLREEVFALINKCILDYLKPGIGSLSVSSTPKNSDVYINNMYQGKITDDSPVILLRDIVRGDYSVMVNKGGYKVWEQLISVEPDKEIKINVDLQLMPGVISVKSNPSDIEVLLDDRPVGKTPLEFEVREGEHEVKLEKDKYLPYVEKVNVKSNQPTKLEVNLQLKPGYIDLKSVPDKAEVWISRKFIGYSPVLLSKVEPGEYRVKISKDNYQDWEGLITVTPDTMTSKTVNLELKKGVLHIDSMPDGANVYIDKETDRILIGTTPLKNHKLDIGEYNIDIIHEDYLRERRKVDINADREVQITAKLIGKPGKLKVTTDPAGLDVYINDNFVGKTPYLIEKIESGKYKLTVKNTYYKLEEDIIIKKGKLTEKHAEIKKPRQYLYSILTLFVITLLVMTGAK